MASTRTLDNFRTFPSHVRKGRYKLTRIIGKGTFGVVYLAVDITTMEEYAVKFESMRYNRLRTESKVLERISRSGGKSPAFVWFGSENNYNILVMQLMGPDLADLFNLCGRAFSLKTILMLGFQMISRLQEVHENNFIHSDIKPENFVLGKGSLKESSEVRIIDFGNVKRYKSIYTDEHICYRSGRPLCGTARYLSVRAHQGIEQSRRDDLEALCYVLLYFLDGALPWQGLSITDVEKKYAKMCEMKKKISMTELCKEFPPEFEACLRYSRNLKFEETPDYEYLRGLFQTMMQNANFEFDFLFDWCKIDKRKQKEIMVSEIPILVNARNNNVSVN